MIEGVNPAKGGIRGKDSRENNKTAITIGCITRQD